MTIASVLWKQKWLAIPVVLLMALGVVYVVKYKPPVYDATSTVLLTNPPKGPTQSQIAAQPDLRQANSDNIFEDYGDLDIVANAVMDDVRSPASEAELSKAGAGTAYQLGLSADFGHPPIVDITGVGSTAGAAVKSARLLTAAVRQDLAAIQLTQGVAPFYLIGGENIVKPAQAQRSSAAEFWPLGIVLGLGAILLFIVVWTGEAIARRRRDRQAADVPAEDEYSPPEDAHRSAVRGAFEPVRSSFEPVRGSFEPARGRSEALR